MRLECDRSELLDALAGIGAVVPSQSVRPVLTHLYLSGSAGTLEVEGTDLEMGGRVRVEGVDVEEGGVAVVPAARLLAIVRELEDGRIRIDALDEGRGVVVRADGSTFKVVGADPADFPRVAEVEGGLPLTLDVGEFLDAVRMVSFAAVKDTTRRQLHGVSLQLSGSQMTLVATDGRRLAAAVVKVGNPGGADTRAISPLKTCDILAKIFTGASGKAQMVITDSSFALSTDAIMVSSKLVQGQFPNCEGVIPTDNPVKLEFEAGPLLAAVRRVSLMTSRDTVAVAFRFSEGALTMTAQSPGAGDARIDVITEYAGETIDLRLNPFFVADMLRVLPAETKVQVEIRDGKTPGLFRVGRDYRYVVMPILSEEGSEP